MAKQAAPKRKAAQAELQDSMQDGNSDKSSAIDSQRSDPAREKRWNNAFQATQTKQKRARENHGKRLRDLQDKFQQELVDADRHRQLEIQKLRKEQLEELKKLVVEKKETEKEMKFLTDSLQAAFDVVHKDLQKSLNKQIEVLGNKTLQETTSKYMKPQQ